MPTAAPCKSKASPAREAGSAFTLQRVPDKVTHLEPEVKYETSINPDNR